MLKTETNYLINEHLKVEIIRTNMNYAKDRAELSETFEGKPNKANQIEKTYNILKVFNHLKVKNKLLGGR